MGLGAYEGGVLFDQLGTYWSLHLGSTLVGGGAVVVVLALQAPARPVPRWRAELTRAPEGPAVDSQPARVL
jgi:hypothetical protein